MNKSVGWDREQAPDRSRTRTAPWLRPRPALGLGMVAVFLAVVAAGCGPSAARAPEKKAPEVLVTTPISDEVADYQDFTGRLDGLKTVDIRARVSGFVLSAPFKEGDLVKEKELLFLIDEKPYQADLNLAAANLKLAEADQNLQQKTASRARMLVSTNAMAQEEYDTAVASYEKSRASTDAVSASRDRAQLYLGYAQVRAPMNGRISRRQVDPGNLVTADTTVLTTIVNDQQLYAYFDVDERTYLDLMGPVVQGESTMSAKLGFPVLSRLANEEQFLRSGVVDFVDNRVNATTGTIRMRAVFENPTGSLRAGMFVRIRLPVGALYQALLIPDEAVLSDQGRKYVFIVDDKDEVVYRPVTLGQEITGLRVIKKGLSKGERVVVGGMQRVRSGVQVHAEMQDPPKRPDSPLGKLLTSNRPSQATSLPGDGANRQGKADPKKAASEPVRPGA